MSATIDLRSEIAAANRNFMAAFSKGDAAAIADLYTRQGELLPAQSDVVRGPDATSQTPASA